MPLEKIFELGIEYRRFRKMLDTGEGFRMVISRENMRRMIALCTTLGREASIPFPPPFGVDMIAVLAGKNG